MPVRPGKIEWPTVALVMAVYSGWALLTWYHESIPGVVWFPAAAWISAWWGSVQHELLHGHPTANMRFNRFLGMPPLWLWLPFDRYRQTHLVHHRDERLTDPIDDPESRYVTPEKWTTWGPVHRALAWSQATLVGRILLGPMLVIPEFAASEFHAIIEGDRRIRAAWVSHAIVLVPTLVWIFGICGVSLWAYLLAFVYSGTGIALIRSFAEHRAAGPVAHRTAVVENSPIFALLFLNNNLHVAHHRWPGVAWYRLPALHAAHREEILSANGALFYDGYWDLFRRFAVSPHDSPIHRLGRAPMRDDIHPGTA